MPAGMYPGMGPQMGGMAAPQPPGVPPAPGAAGPNRGDVANMLGSGQDIEQVIQQLAAMGVAPQKLQKLRQQVAQANQLRNRQGPEGRQAGRAYVAANPLEHIAHGLETYRARRQQRDLGQQQDAAIGDISQGRQSGMRMMADQLRGIPNTAAPMQRPGPTTPQGRTQDFMNTYGPRNRGGMYRA